VEILARTRRIEGGDGGFLALVLRGKNGRGIQSGGKKGWVRGAVRQRGTTHGGTEEGGLGG
jgi:hypothetical protein